jgi:hypothetical protein
MYTVISCTAVLQHEKHHQTEFHNSTGDHIYEENRAANPTDLIRKPSEKHPRNQEKYPNK